jgi:hypothetical protein
MIGGVFKGESTSGEIIQGRRAGNQAAADSAGFEIADEQGHSLAIHWENPPCHAWPANGPRRIRPPPDTWLILGLPIGEESLT